MATGSGTALHCFTDTRRANESKKTDREEEKQGRKERDRCCGTITLELERVMSWPMMCISVGGCIKPQSNYASL